MDIWLGAGLFFWSAAVVKKLLFWVWLWQLKEYHWGRFRAHFRTAKGKRVLLSPLKVVKAGLLALFFLFSGLGLPYLLVLPFLVVITGLVFGLEVLVFAYRFFQGRVLRPVLTKRTIPTLFLGVLFVAGCLGAGLHFLEGENFFEGLIAFDILCPFFFSLVVVSFQPLVLVWQKGLLKRASKKRESAEDLTVVGITGSYGKSSTKEALAAVLGARFEVLKTKKNQNSEVGIARCLLDQLEAKHQVFVCEIGAYNKGKIRQVANMVQPRIGILTGINEQHLATFGSQKKIIEGKFELIEALPKDGAAVLNRDNEHIRFMIHDSRFRNKKIIKCSTLEKADLWAEDIRVEKDKLCFKMVSKQGGRAEVNLSVVGKQNIINFLMAAAVARELGMNLGDIAERAGKIKGAESGMSLKKATPVKSRKRDSAEDGAFNGVEEKVDVIDDTYSANPHGVKAALKHLTHWKGKKVVVMPCLIELGKAGKRIHREIGERIGEVCDLAIITTRDYFPQIKKAARRAGMREENILFLRKSEKILEKLKPYLKKGNVIVLESRVPERLKTLLISMPNSSRILTQTRH